MSRRLAAAATVAALGLVLAGCGGEEPAPAPVRTVGGVPAPAADCRTEDEVADPADLTVGTWTYRLDGELRTNPAPVAIAEALGSDTIEWLWLCPAGER